MKITVIKTAHIEVKNVCIFKIVGFPRVVRALVFPDVVKLILATAIIYFGHGPSYIEVFKRRSQLVCISCNAVTVETRRHFLEKIEEVNHLISPFLLLSQ